MPEFSELQEAVLKIIQENVEKNLLPEKECRLTSKEIFDLIPEGKRPAEFRYINAVIENLEGKKKIETESKFVIGHRGMKRIIKVL